MGDQAAAVRGLREPVVPSIFLALARALIDAEPLPEEARKRFRESESRCCKQPLLQAHPP
jgi:hypothetical protein